MSATTSAQTHTQARHPLDPLSADEFRATVTILRRDQGVTDRWRIASIELNEPPKELVAAYRTADPIVREAIVVCWDRGSGDVYKALVSLTEDRVVSWQHLPGVQPNATVDEWHECAEQLVEDPLVVEALARRGITDTSTVHIDMWTYGDALIPDQYRGRRIGWCDVWHRDAAGRNAYAHHVSGLHFVVDLNSMTLLEVEDTGAVEPPPVMGEYVSEHVPGLEQRDDLKPLEISQPDGVSFTVDGYELRWQRWRMRLGFNYREGVVLHCVGYEDEGRVRSIAHRMSFAEMVVPYRDPTVDHYRRTAFDIGEWGLGFMTTSLKLGCDCLGEIRYVDAVLHDSRGEPYTIENAVCIHEEDNAVLWKHVDPPAAEVRRSRRLVISAHFTVANYEYLVYWRFYQDGNIECEVRATGLMVTTPFAEGSKPPYGTQVDERTYAPFHQHFIVARLDLDVDGPDNLVYMTESEALPVGPENPHGLALVAREVPLRTEREGRQDYRWETQRGWKVVNPGVTNRLGTPVGYKLVPGACFPAMIDPSSPVLRRAEVIGHTLWATRYAQDERWPCGEFVNQSAEDTGLPVWTAQDRSIDDTDVVLWYVFGLHHITRMEEWPVMPVDTVSFWLKPFGFFARNPALDVAPSPPSACTASHDGSSDEGEDR
ncbi:primary-amine oxidase [Pseudonocardia sp.]|uniref:primary-amine oxidase n=1 Tax=Pseudonocardia sp. TaxID=60912 RepID=UPI003D0F1A2F